MKSKKLVALALTAAMAISAVSTTAFAATVDVKKNAELWEQIATVKFEDSDVGKTRADTKTLDPLPNTSLYKFVGWVSGTGINANKLKAAYETTSDDAALTKLGTATLVKDNKVDYQDIAIESYNGQDPSNPTRTITQDEVDTKSLVLYPLYRRWATEEEAKKAADDAKNAADEKAAQDDRDAKLKAEDANHSATDNMRNIGAPDTDPDKDKETATKSAAADMLGVTGDSKMVNDAEHAFKVAGISDPKKGDVIAVAYDVHDPAGWELLTGKNARVTLKLPKGYTTNGYKVTVYHIVDACKKVKVTGLNVGTNDVTFWANDFSPYVLVLTPKDSVASTGTDNPGTGDFSAVPVALLAAAALGATGFVAYKKRKAE